MAPSIAPARAAAFDVIRRVFEDEAYADRALRTATAGLDDRDRALARQLAYGTVQRARTLDHAIETLGRRPVRRLDAAGARGAPARRLPARLPRRGAPLRGRQRVGRARAPGAARAGRPVHERRSPPPRRRGPRRASRRCRTRPGRRRRWRTRTPTGSPRRGGATSAPRARVALMRAQNEAPPTVVRLVRGEIDGAPDPDVPGAWHVDHVDESRVRRGPDLAAERRLAARRARRRLRAGERVLDLCAAPAARRRCSPARSSPSR